MLNFSSIIEGKRESLDLFAQEIKFLEETEFLSLVVYFVDGTYFHLKGLGLA